MSNIKVSAIGCGYWGKNLIRNFSELNSLVSICDADQSLAENIAQQYQVPSYTLDQILESEVDGVVIATPAIRHYEAAKKALEAGKHVFVEKPLALKVEEAKYLCDLASKTDCILMVGHLLQYHPAFLKLKQLISQGNLGRLQYIYSNRLNLGKFRSEENILWSFAPHDISMILSLAAGLPETVFATGVCHLNPNIHDFWRAWISLIFYLFLSDCYVYLFA